ncbi:MAG: DUF362 domain-containing protein [Candidatus Latescibacter sp.]|nr:DUF362 domain-containing protein [Candidatus Latescibacter sp.]
MTRKQFIAGLATSSLLFPGSHPSPAATEKSAVVYEAFDERMVNGNKPIGTKVDEKTVIAAVNSIIKKMSGKNDIGKAWQKLLPGVTPQSKIAIKLNLLHPYNGPQFAILKAVVLGLKSMFKDSFPPGHIFAFDNTADNISGRVDATYGPDNLNALGIVRNPDEYTGDAMTVAGKTMYISKTLSDADYGICMVASRRHQYFAGQLSGVIKNMMGALSTNTTRYEALMASNEGGFHDNSNYAAYIDMFKNYMKDHLHLYIADHVLIPLNEARPYVRVGNRIVIGKDPCAVDTRSVDILNSLFTFEESEKPTTTVPMALAKAGIGTIKYELKTIPVSLD